MKQKSQLFCRDIPNTILYDLLDNVTKMDISQDNSNNRIEYYKLDKILFKKLEYHNLLNNFLQSLKQYYYSNKQLYLERTMTYNNFLTIIRQICKYNNITIKKQIIYQKDTYSIEYYIYKNIIF
tara:strand:- start:109 stop:480 length:372 start_codon:yes stop_codon:yes gene_type:complete